MTKPSKDSAAVQRPPQDRGDLENASRRRTLMSSHPMVERGYLLNTRMIEQAYDLAFRWLALHKSGLVFKGLQRTGKTYACLRIRDQLSVDLPNLPVVLISGERNPTITKERFCRRTLETVGFKVDEVPARSSYVSILKNYLISRCLNAKSRSVALLIDEAQMLSVTQYRYLFELLNTMQLERYNLVTLMFGQPNLDDLLRLSEEREHQEILGRFFVQVHPFGGVRSQDELRCVLSQYDGVLRFPSESRDWSFSRYFARDAFDDGWRLEAETERFWQALAALSNVDAKDVPGSGFRMPWVIDAIHYVLVDALTGGVSPPFTAARWSDAINFVMRPEMLV